MTIKDFPCNYDYAKGIRAEIAAKAQVTFPDVHTDPEMMARLSKTLKESEGSAYCVLPFCHTLEAEAFGASISYGDETAGPRCKEYVFERVEDLTVLPDIDLFQGRIAQVLSACEILSKQGENVLVEICGPITVMNSLMDPKLIYKTLRKDKQVMREVCCKIGEQVLRFAREAKARGAKLISFADSAGVVGILGPKLSEDMVEIFVCDYARQLSELADASAMVMLCPKTTFTLLGTNKIRLENVSLPAPMRYGEACLEMIGKVKLSGAQCYKNVNFICEDHFKKIVLL